MKVLRILLALLLFPTIALASEVRITADRLTYNRREGVIYLEGNVRAWYGGAYFEAQRVLYWIEDHYLVAEGDVLLKEGGDILRAGRAELDTETKEGVLYDARIFLKRRHFHITGRKVEKLGERRYRIEEATLTSCDDSPPSWKFTCRRLDVEVEGFAKGWWPGFRVKDVPLLYLPWATFPVKRERQTGFLIPSISFSNRYGPIVTLPFFWAISKDQDATFYLTRHGDARGRGFKGGVEYRFARSTTSQGSFRLFWLRDQVEGEYRWALFSDQRHLLPGGIKLLADVNLVSDKDYPSDFEEDLGEEVLIDARSKNQMESTLHLWKGWGWGEASLEFSYFRDLEVDDNDATLQRLPKATFEIYKRPLGKTPLKGELQGEAVHFWRQEGVRGGRFEIRPKVSLPMAPLPPVRFEPWLQGRGTLYLTQDPEGKYDDLSERGLMEAGWSISTTLFKRYPTSNGLLLHLVEPKLLYRWRPDVPQGENPEYDSTDRLPPESLFTLELTQRLKWLSKGEERRIVWGRLSQGFDTFPDLPWEERLKDLEAEFHFTPREEIDLEGEVSYDHHRRRFDTAAAGASIIYKGLKLRGEYRFNRDEEVEEVNLSAAFTPHRKIDLWTSFKYDLKKDYRVETEYGLRYKHQCWEVALSLLNKGRSPDGTQRAEWRAMVEITLKGIGSFKVK
ncbi:MAG: hypothetical protein DRG33_02235 [Deltaproteobacteria bacterium]|nr:MAG: hypothetical protein DRG33_02235 [Deltaproteobacteria bacterium]